MKPPLFSCLTSRVANNGSLYGRFLFGPLPIDISLTVATVLRRSLLHSQATFTIVSAEIEGATHEYASLPGIQESVLEILLNLGEIVLTSTQRNLINPNFRTSIGTNPFFFANIRVSGPGIVTAKDINWPKGIFCVKPNSVICTLSSNETLTMRLKIACSLNKSKNKQPLYKNEIETKENKTKSDFSINSFEQANLKDLKVNKTQHNEMPVGAPTALSEKTVMPMLDGHGHGEQGSVSERQGRHNTKSLFISSQDNKEDLFTNKNKQNQFESFKSQENLSTSTSVNSFETNPFTATSVNESHFIRIQNKNLISFKTKEKKTSKDNNRIPYQQTIDVTQRLLTKETGSLDSYSIRKKKAKQIETPVDFYPITNKETIFHDNKQENQENQGYTSSIATSWSCPEGKSMATQKKELRIAQTTQENQEDQEDQEKNQNKSQSQDLDQNVTFRIFPGLFNDFKEQKQTKADLFLIKKENEGLDVKNAHALTLPLLTVGHGIASEASAMTIGQQRAMPKGKATPLSNSKDIVSYLASQKAKQKNELKIRTFKHELLVSSSSYPVEKVNFLIERDDELAGYRHRIILEVWTNGSISPRQAIFESIGSIIKLIYNFREPLRNSFS